MRKNIKITTAVTIFGLIGSLVVNPLISYAQTITPTNGTNMSKADRLARFHTLCDNSVDQRVTVLNNALSRINGLKKLSQTQKSQFESQINTNITGLTSQKAKCDADTDLPTLRTDYRNVFLQFRIYVVFLPQIHLLVASDTMGVTADKLNDLANKLQDRINKAGNPSNLTTLLADMQSKIAYAESQYSTVQSMITPITPSSYNQDPNGTKAIEQTARGDIKTGASDLQGAFSDAKQIIQALKALNISTTPTGVTSPTPGS